jgi:hypothetical protein
LWGNTWSKNLIPYPPWLSVAETAVVQSQGSKKIALSWEKGVQQSKTCVGNPADSLICSTQVHEFHMCSYHVDLQPQDNHEKLRALTLFAAESKKNVMSQTPTGCKPLVSLAAHLKFVSNALSRRR